MRKCLIRPQRHRGHRGIEVTEPQKRIAMSLWQSRRLHSVETGLILTFRLGWRERRFIGRGEESGKKEGRPFTGRPRTINPAAFPPRPIGATF